MYDIPGTFYSSGYGDKTDTGPALAVERETGTIRAFVMEKDNGLSYGMSGYIYRLSGGTFEKEANLFTSSNYGWFPYFTWDSGGLLLNFFSYAGYYRLWAYQSDGWTLNFGEQIDPDDFKALQQQHDLICIY